MRTGSYISVSAFLPPANEVWGKVIFLHLFVILFTGGACMVLFGGRAWFYLGGCVVRGFIRGGAWFYSGGRGFIRGACVVLFGGHAWFYSGGHAWFFQFFRIQ